MPLYHCPGTADSRSSEVRKHACIYTNAADAAHPYFVVRRLVTPFTQQLDQFVNSQVAASVLVGVTKELLVFARHDDDSFGVVGTRERGLFCSVYVWRVATGEQ